MLGEGLAGAGNVRLLEHVAAQKLRVHLAGNRHQGDAVHVSGGNAGNQVGGTGPEVAMHTPGFPLERA